MNQLFILMIFSNFCYSQADFQEVKPIFGGGVPKSTQDTLTPSLIWVEGGSMMLGCTDDHKPSEYYDISDEKPAHNVTISGFHIGKFEVTNAEFCRFLNANKDSLTLEYYSSYNINIPVRAFWYKHYNGYGYNFIIEDIDRAIILPKKDEPILYKPYPGFENHPVRMVSFLAALKYTEWLSKISGQFYRLPTEAEWEYAARGGILSNCHKDSCYVYAGSNDGEGINWTTLTEKVGSFKPNELGIYDMSGNVNEWVLDVYDKDYYKKLPKNPTNPYREYNGTPLVNYEIRFSNKKGHRVHISSAEDPVIQLPQSEYDKEGKELERVIKGGGFINHPLSWRVSYRSSSIKADHTVGFRIVRID